jgi:ATPase subunit of ABC transporter with duplicated ATPase domains
MGPRRDADQTRDLPMISVRGLSKRYGPKELFSNVSLELRPGNRYGLVGANGSGKSTLLRILSGDEHQDEGDFSFSAGSELGVLRQDQFANDDESILDVAMRGDAPVFSALEELDRASHSDIDPDRLAELSEMITRRDGYSLEARASEILVGLGIPQASLRAPLKTLSGGYKLRVLLAKVLVGRPSILLLDEPTNHLDILSIHWLEGFLANSNGVVLVISHDRRFLDRATNRTLDVDYGTITEYLGNFSAFLELKATASEDRELSIARAERIIAEKRAFVERFGAKATKAKQAQSRLKQIEKIEVLDVQRTSRRSPAFSFQEGQKTGKDVLTVRELNKAYGEKVVLRKLEFLVRRGEKVAIIGENGIGKSTLIKIFAERVQADSGTHVWGANVKLGYFAQDHNDLLREPKLTPLEFVYDAVPQETVSYVRGQLGKMLFSGDDVHKKVSLLSGGEAARLVFARLLVEKPNVLLLDEPTNHLDLEAISELAAALQAYSGTLLFVSHDRWFVSEVATRVIELRADGFSDFAGTFAEYLERAGTDHLDAKTVSLLSRSASTEPAKIQVDSHEERRRRANRLKALPKKRDEVLAQIAALEAKKAEIDGRFADSHFFETVARDEQQRLQLEQSALAARIEAHLAEWEALELEITELEQA